MKNKTKDTLDMAGAVGVGVAFGPVAGYIAGKCAANRIKKRNEQEMIREELEKTERRAVNKKDVPRDFRVNAGKKNNY